MNYMQSQLLISLMAIGVAAAGMGVGTFAFFSDEGSSTDNVFNAADIDLHLDAGESTTQTIQFLGTMVPGDTASGSIDVSNDGANYDSNDFDLDIAADYIETEGSPHYATPDESFASFLELTTLSYGTDDFLAAGGCEVTDVNGNGWVDIDDWDSQACIDLADPGASTTMSIAVLFRTEAGNGAQGDDVDLSIRFLLGQSNAGAPDIAA